MKNFFEGAKVILSGEIYAVSLCKNVNGRSNYGMPQRTLPLYATRGRVYGRNRGYGGRPFYGRTTRKDLILLSIARAQWLRSPNPLAFPLSEAWAMTERVARSKKRMWK